MAWYSAFGGAALALVLVTGVSACGNKTKPVAEAAASRAEAEALFAEALARPKTRDAGAFDAEQLKGFLGEWGELTYTSAGADAATGAYKLEGVRFVPADEALAASEGISLSADEILVWNFSLDAIDARREGQKLTETLRVFDRIEFGGLAFVVDDAFATAESLPGAAQSPLPGMAGQQEMRINMTTGRLVMGGLTLHPWLYAATDGASEEQEGIRLISALMRSFSLDTFLVVDAEFDQTSNSDALSAVAKSRYARQLLKGYDRGNLSALVQTGAAFSMDMTPDDPALAADFSGIKMESHTGYSAWSGLKLAPLLEWGERGELPPITALEGWSIGSYAIEDMSFSMDSQPLFQLGKLALTAEKLSWFFPEEIGISYEGLTINLSSLMTVGEKFAALSGEPIDGPSPAEIAGVLERSGLGKITSTGKFSLNWNRETGHTLAQGNAQTPGLFNEDWKAELTLPSFAEIVPAFGADGQTPDEDALDNLLKDRLTVIGGHWTLTDAGGLNAISRLVIEGAKIGATNDQMLSGFAESTPEAVRSFAAGGLTMISGEAAKEIPEARNWLMRTSDFINQGGTLSIRVAPQKPVSAATMTALDTGGMSETNPSDVVRLFGFDVIHTPPAAAQPR